MREYAVYYDSEKLKEVAWSVIVKDNWLPTDDYYWFNFATGLDEVHAQTICKALKEQQDI